MRVLAVTGGIGSGKSHIVKMFASMGIPVYDTDSRAKSLYDESQWLKESIADLLGHDLLENGRLRRDVMAKRLFADPLLLMKLEALVHPAVVEDFLKWKERKRENGAKFVIMESAIFLEKEILPPLADKVLVVSAPLDLRISRVMKRSSLTKEEIEKRIANQWSDGQREKFADFVIYSDESKALLPQILEIYKKMIG